MPTPQAPSREPTILPAEAQPAVAEVGASYARLMRLLEGPSAVRALPSGTELAKLFPDALSRRADGHLRVHAIDPAVDLPDDDHDLDKWWRLGWRRPELLSAIAGLRRGTSCCRASRSSRAIRVRLRLAGDPPSRRIAAGTRRPDRPRRPGNEGLVDTHRTSSRIEPPIRLI